LYGEAVTEAVSSPVKPASIQRNQLVALVTVMMTTATVMVVMF